MASRLIGAAVAFVRSVGTSICSRTKWQQRNGHIRPVKVAIAAMASRRRFATVQGTPGVYGGIAIMAALTGKGFPFLVATSDREWKWAAVPRLGRLYASPSMPVLPCIEIFASWVGEEAEFDPVGFSVWYVLEWLREAELKHGRVTMVKQLFKNSSRPQFRIL